MITLGFTFVPFWSEIIEATQIRQQRALNFIQTRLVLGQTDYQIRYRRQGLFMIDRLGNAAKTCDQKPQMWKAA